MVIEILFSGIKDITKLYISKEVEDDGFGKITLTDYVAKDYCEKILTEVVYGFEVAKSLSYIGCLERIGNEVFDFIIKESKYRATFTIDTYESKKARVKVKLEQIEPTSEYDFILEQLKFGIKNRMIGDWNRCIWVTDEQSEALCTLLYPMLFKAENEMRAFVNKVLIHYVGVNWIKKIGMEKFDLSHKKLMGDFRRISPQYSGVDDTFISMTLETMMDIIKNGKTYDENIIMSSADWDALNEKRNKSAEAVLAYIKKKRKISIDIWEDIFKQYFDFDLLIITDFIKNRNHVAHNKLLNWPSMQIIQQNIESFKNNIESADRKFEESDLSEELNMTIDAEEEAEREETEAREWEENYLRDRIQGDTGVEILTDDGILEEFNEIFYTMYSEIYDEYYFNPCFNISQQYAIELESNEQILFTISSNAIKESEIEVVVELWLDGNMNSDSSATISCRKMNEKEEFLFTAQIRYHNGSGYEDYNEGGVVLESESKLDDSELDDFKTNLKEYIEEELNPIIKKLKEYRETSDVEIPVSAEVCIECDNEGISISDEFYPEGFCCFCGTDNNE